MIKCYTLSVRETKLNWHTRPSLARNVGWNEVRWTRGGYSDYIPETVQRYEGTILKMVLLGLLGTSLTRPKNSSEKGHVKYDGSHFMCHHRRDLNLKSAKCLSWQNPPNFMPANIFPYTVYCIL